MRDEFVFDKGRISGLNWSRIYVRKYNLSGEAVIGILEALETIDGNAKWMNLPGIMSLGDRLIDEPLQRIQLFGIC